MNWDNLDGWKRIESPVVGAAAYRSCDRRATMIVSAEWHDGHPWAHLSIARRDRLPSWPELVAVRDAVLGPDVQAVQVIPPRSEYVNDHARCLHLWAVLDGRVVPDFRKFAPTLGRLSI